MENNQKRSSVIPRFSGNSWDIQKSLGFLPIIEWILPQKISFYARSGYNNFFSFFGSFGSYGTIRTIKTLSLTNLAKIVRF